MEYSILNEIQGTVFGSKHSPNANKLFKRDTRVSVQSAKTQSPYITPYYSVINLVFNLTKGQTGQTARELYNLLITPQDIFICM